MESTTAIETVAAEVTDSDVTFLKKISEGSYGQVWLAYLQQPEQEKQIVAIKIEIR